MILSLILIYCWFINIIPICYYINLNSIILFEFIFNLNFRNIILALLLWFSFIGYILYRLFNLYSYRVYCLIGDGESAEGSNWEAFNFASLYNLDNLVAIIDVNRLGQSEATCLQHKMDVYEARLKAFGFVFFILFY